MYICGSTWTQVISSKVHAQLFAEGVHGALWSKSYVLLIFKSAICTCICYFITFTDCLYTYRYEAVVVVIVWSLVYSIQSAPITNNVLSSNPLRQCVLDTTLCDKVCQLLATGRWFSPDPPVSPTNKSDRHNIAAILLKVAFNTMALTLTLYR